MPKMTPSEAMTEVLVQEGVNHVSGILGSAFMDMLDLFPAAGIDFISVRHEQTAGHMEDAYARLQYCTQSHVCSTVYDAALSFPDSDYGNIHNVVLNTVYKTITSRLQLDFIAIRHT